MMGRKRGGGPKTEAGKAIVRRNPIRHGVLAQTPVIPLVEKPEDWRVERQLLGRAAPKEPTRQTVAEMDGMMMARLLPGEETLERVMRYETRLHRFLLQTMQQFLIL